MVEGADPGFRFGNDWCDVILPAFLRAKARKMGYLKAHDGVDCTGCLGVITKARRGKTVQMVELECHHKCACASPEKTRP